MTDNPGPPPNHGPDPGLEALPENIRRIQAVRGYTDQDMAEAIGVSPSTWQRRKRTPGEWTLQQARRIARVLDVELTRLTMMVPPGRLPDEADPCEVSNGA